METPVVWVLFIEVEALLVCHSFQRGDKAFVNVCVAELSSALAESQAIIRLRELGFHVVRVEEALPWDQRQKDERGLADLKEMVAECRSGSTVVVGTFHTWRNQG